jgi:hypothetical protein
MMINEIINKKYMVVQPYNPSSWEYEAGGSRVQDQSELPWEFQASLGYRVRACLQKTKGTRLAKCLL